MKLLVFIFALALFPIAQAEPMQIIWKNNQQPPIILEIKDLQKMPNTSFTTDLPWLNGESKFTGVSVSDLFDELDVELPEVMTVRGLNDYSVDVLKSDIEQYHPIIAFLKDGNLMPVRYKGPYWLIYSLNQYPELDTPAYHSQMVWQIEKIELIGDDE
ncbi:MAG: oxidoreductase [Vibrio gallaecicus]|uniref:oxidoreductase n=1 Tax=Vibrio TaxID=662 RepID=UPI0010C972D7|nr:oxidoreductase [Vibrio gallaecicus]MDN3613871.1 oxidoreductase [Vibrio gallaecicus]